MSWHPRVTVATLIPREGRFLLVHERAEQGLVYNQPAGHLEPGETLVEAAVRETLEETGWQVDVQAVLGVCLYKSPLNGETYMRTSFVARPIAAIEGAQLDSEIVEAVWLTPDEIVARREQMRSPMVLGDIERYYAGMRFPLTILSSYF